MWIRAPAKLRHEGHGRGLDHLDAGRFVEKLAAG